MQQDRAGVAEGADLVPARAGTRRRRRGSCRHPVAEAVVEADVRVDEGVVAGGDRRAGSRSQRPCTSAACAMVSARAAASPGGTWRPVTPSSTSSAMPPMPETDHRAPGGAGLVDDERRVLPPGRGHHHPVHGPHQRADVGPVVRAGVPGQRRGGMEAGFELRAEGGVGPAEAAVERDPEIGAGAPEARGGVEKNERRPCAGRWCRRSRSGRGGTARRRRAATGCGAVALGSSRMRRGAIPQSAKRSRRKALGAMKASTGSRSASRCACRSAWRAALWSGKQRRQRSGRAPLQRAASPVVRSRPVVGADELVVVQREDDAAARSEAADHREHLGADPVEAVQVDDVGTGPVEDAAEGGDPAGAVQPGHREAVVGAGLQHEILAMGAQRARRGGRVLQRGRGREEAGGDADAGRQGRARDRGRGFRCRLGSSRDGRARPGGFAWRSWLPLIVGRF